MATTDSVGNVGLGAVPRSHLVWVLRQHLDYTTAFSVVERPLGPQTVCIEHFCCWPEADMHDQPEHFRSLGLTGRAQYKAFSALMTHSGPSEPAMPTLWGNWLIS